MAAKTPPPLFGFDFLAAMAFLPAAACFAATPPDPGVSHAVERDPVPGFLPPPDDFFLATLLLATAVFFRLACKRTSKSSGRGALSQFIDER